MGIEGATFTSPATDSISIPLANLQQTGVQQQFAIAAINNAVTIQEDTITRLLDTFV